MVMRLVELLKEFNKQTYELILKGNAMEVAGLKMITAKHLGLALQSAPASPTNPHPHPPIRPQSLPPCPQAP